MFENKAHAQLIGNMTEHACLINTTWLPSN